MKTDLGPHEPDIVMYIKVKKRSRLPPCFCHNEIVECEMLYIVTRYCTIFRSVSQ